MELGKGAAYRTVRFVIHRNYLFAAIKSLSKISLILQCLILKLYRMKTNLLCLSLLILVGLGAQSQSTHFWGTSTSGGATGSGTIFIANTDGSNLHTVYNFVNATGAYP